MARLLKCQLCGVADTPKEGMKYELIGEKKPVKKYYHESCYEEHLKVKEFKRKEQEELDKLVEVIKEIYNIKTVPNSIYPFLQDLRNGNKFFGKKDYKYKQGYEYGLIAETFKYCSDTIEYWNERKNFNGLTSALRYGLAIICDKLYIVENRMKNAEKQKILVQKHIENVGVETEEYTTTYKKPSKSKSDISEFLED